MLVFDANQEPIGIIRAKKVKQYLVSHGIEPSLLVIDPNVVVHHKQPRRLMPQFTRYIDFQPIK